jgi:GNAT superfamily N-acetyltransferase
MTAVRGPDHRSRAPERGSFDLRRLDRSDVAACVNLAVSQGWPAEERKWDLLLTVGQAYGADDGESGRLIGSVIATSFEPSLVVVGMLLVAPSHTNRGLGRLLMDEVITRAGGRTVLLYSTPRGRPLYDDLGFRVVDAVGSYIGIYQGESHPESRVSRPFSPADATLVAALDDRAMGGDRSPILDRLPAFAQQMAVVDDSRGPVGYAAAWNNGDVVHIGPVVAEGDPVAKALIHELAGQQPGRIRIDLSPRWAGIAASIEEHGLRRQSIRPLMARGGLPGRREHLFAPFMQALG